VSTIGLVQGKNSMARCARAAKSIEDEGVRVAVGHIVDKPPQHLSVFGVVERNFPHDLAEGLYRYL